MMFCRHDNYELRLELVNKTAPLAPERLISARRDNNLLQTTLCFDAPQEVQFDAKLCSLPRESRVLAMLMRADSQQPTTPFTCVAWTSWPLFDIDGTMFVVGVASALHLTL